MSPKRRTAANPGADSRRHLNLDDPQAAKPSKQASLPTGDVDADAAAVKKSFIRYLERKLCRSGPRHLRFTKVGPSSFLHWSQRDTIFVKVSDQNLILVTDGELVVDHMEMHFIAFREDDEDVFDHHLQMILGLF